MTQNQEMHQHPNYSLTTSLFVAEIVYRLVCWGEQAYLWISRTAFADQMRRHAKAFFNGT